MFYVYVILFILLLFIVYFRKEIAYFIVKFVFRFLPEPLAEVFASRLTNLFFAIEVLIISQAVYPLYRMVHYLWLYNVIFTGFVIGGAIVLMETINLLFIYMKGRSVFLKEADAIDLTNFLTTISRFVISIIAIITLVKQYSQDEFKLSSLIYFLSFLTAGVSFAARGYIANFFGSLSILFNNPFSKGDKISIDDVEGRVESFGFQQTIVRQKDQALVYIPNSKLIVKSLFKNKSRMKNRPILIYFYISAQIQEEFINKSFEEILRNLSAFEGMIKNNKPEIYIETIEHGLFKVHVKTVARHSENIDMLKQKVLMTIRDALGRYRILFENESKQD